MQGLAAMGVPMTVSPESPDLDAIRARAEAATPGPWTWCAVTSSSWMALTAPTAGTCKRKPAPSSRELSPETPTPGGEAGDWESQSPVQEPRTLHG